MITRCTVLDLTHQRVTSQQHLWAIRLRYRPGIVGVVVAHDDGIVRTEDLDWDWVASPWPRVAVMA
jgi:hypothetical protein